VLPSKLHESVFEQLRDVTARTKAALRKGDTEGITQLALEHKSVMNKLNQEGLGTNATPIDLVKEASDAVREVMAEIGKRRDKLGQQLVEMGKRRKMVYAYARNA
jgi:predicted transcriptional regulator